MTIRDIATAKGISATAVYKRFTTSGYTVKEISKNGILTKDGEKIAIQLFNPIFNQDSTIFNPIQPVFNQDSTIFNPDSTSDSTEVENDSTDFQPDSTDIQPVFNHEEALRVENEYLKNENETLRERLAATEAEAKVKDETITRLRQNAQESGQQCAVLSERVAWLERLTEQYRTEAEANRQGLTDANASLAKLADQAQQLQLAQMKRNTLGGFIKGLLGRG